MARKVGVVAVDRMRWLFALTLVALGVWASSTVGESLLYRVLIILSGVILASLILAQTVQGRAFSALLRESRIEIRKVVWPTNQEALQTLLLVLIFVVIMALLLWGLDSILGRIAGAIIG